MSDDQLNELREISQTLRQSIIHELVTAGSGHAAGCLGFADVMAVLYFYAMRLDPENPDWQDRDIFVMSNGHYAPLLYATLAERGFFDKKELVNLRNLALNFRVIQNVVVCLVLKRRAVLWVAA
mgnify:CR=1 FL=1